MEEKLNLGSTLADAQEANPKKKRKAQEANRGEASNPSVARFSFA